MNKFTLTGSALGGGGVIVFGFQAISSIMHTKNIWNDLTLASVTDHRIDTIIEMVPFESLLNGLNYLAQDLPLYQLLLGSGVLLFFIGSFLKK